jgi:enoyl-CoA hydratase/carnithine racemase
MRNEFETITVERRDSHVLLVTLNRPEAANALNTRMGLDLVELFEGFSVDIEGLRAIILTGAGSKAFCAGGDLKQRNGMTDEAWQAQHLVFERMLRAILACPVPVIAAVNGAAYGGGCEIAAAADFVYAASGARFALTEVTLGIMPGAGGTQNLPRAIGERRAKEMILSGLPFSAAEAEAWGLVNKVLPEGQLLEATFAIALRIAGNGPIAVRQAKQAIHRGLQMSLNDGLAFEIEAYNRLVPTDDRREGVAAFNERRKADFRGK